LLLIRSARPDIALLRRALPCGARSKESKLSFGLRSSSTEPAISSGSKEA